MAEDLELRLARKRQFSEFLEWEDRDGWSLKSQVEQSMLQRKGEAIVGLKTARQVSVCGWWCGVVCNRSGPERPTQSRCSAVRAANTK